MEINGYTRNHASWLLRCWGRTVYSYQGGRPVKIVVGTRRPRRRSPQLYDQEVYRALKHVWELFGGMCGKRLVEVLRHQMPVLEKFGELSNDDVEPHLYEVPGSRNKSGRTFHSTDLCNDLPGRPR